MKSKESVCAMSLKLNTKRLAKLYPSDSWTNAYRTIETLLGYKGFTLQGKLFVGKPTLTPSDCVRAILYLKDKLPWFADSVKYLELVRVQEPVDLLPILRVTDR